MAAAKTALILGATGAQGGAVFDGVLATKQFATIKLGTRDPTSDKAKALAKKGGEPVEYAWLDEASVAAALKDVTHVYYNSNFWGLMAEYKGDAAKVSEVELQMTKTFAKVAAASPTLEHIVFSGLESIVKLSGGKLKAEHFDAKGECEDVLLADKVLAPKLTIARWSFYSENFGGFLQPSDDGVINIPMEQEALFVVNVADAGKAVAAIFAAGKPWYGKAIGLATDSIKLGEVEDQLSLLFGKKITYAPMDYEAYGKLWPGASDLASMYKAYCDYPDKIVRDVAATKKLVPDMLSFKDWVAAKVGAEKSAKA